MSDNYVQAEALLIGKLLIYQSDYYEVAHLLSTAHFSDLDLAEVFSAIAAIAEAGFPVNRLSLQARLGERYAKLEPRLRELYLQAHVPGSVTFFAECVLDGYRRRQALQLAERLATAAYNSETNMTEIQAQVAGELLGTVSLPAQESSATVAERVQQTLSAWAAQPLAPGQVRGLASGLRNLDRVTGGLLPGYLIAAGRPGMGKTALALQIAANVAETGTPVLYLTFEISADLLLLRLASARCNVAVIDGYTGNLRPEDAARLKAAVQEIAAWPLEFYAGTPQINQVVALLHRAARTLKPGLVVIDNLGHLTAPGYVRAEYDELNIVSRRLKEVVNSTGIPLLALHQLSRGTESRENKEPTMADLRGSGHLEQDADQVWLLYRAGYYSGNTSDHGFNVAIPKNRLTGRTGQAALFFTACAGLRDAALPGVSNGRP